LCNPVKKKKKIIIFLIFPSNGANVERNWQGKTELLGGKTCASATSSTTSPTWTVLGNEPGPPR
jgi:hypothetical protein